MTQGHTPELAGQLTSNDFGPDQGPVIVVFDDGSHATFRNAFSRQEGDNGEYLVVYSGNTGHHVLLGGGLTHIYGEHRD